MKKKKLKSFRILWDTNNHTYIFIMGIQERKRKSRENIWEIMAEKFPNFLKYMNLESQGTQWTLSGLNKETHTKIHYFKIVESQR